MSTLATQTSGDNGFFSDILGSFKQGIQTIGSDLLPIWAARELKVQQTDTLNQAVYNPSTAPNRINDGLQTTAGPAQTGSQVQSAQAKPAGLLFDNISVSGAAVFGVAIAVIIGIVAARA